MLPNIVQTKSNDNSSKDPNDQVWLLMQVSLMIEIMRFFCIKRECDTSSKAMLELRRLILRGSLEVHVGDCMMLMGLLLRISWGSDEFDKHPWEKRVFEEVTRGLDIPGSIFRGRNFEMRSLMDDIFSMRRSSKGKC